MPGEAAGRADWSERLGSWRGPLTEGGWCLLMLLPGVLTLYLGFRSGGFYLGATSLAAAEMALVVGLRFALTRRPLRGVSPAAAVAICAMGAFVLWTLVSADWSDAASRALPAYSRALLYGLTLLFFASLPFNPRRIRWLVYGIAAAAVAICVAALIARLRPDMIFDLALVDEHRLGYPLTYWNALGILSCVGIVLCSHIACSVRDAAPARILGAAAVPLLSVTLYYTLSRGGIWAVAGALAIYAVLGRPRALLSGVLAIAPTTFVALSVASPAAEVADRYPATLAAGEHVALVLGGCMLATMVLRAALLPLDSWLAGLRLPPGARKPALAAAAGVGLVLVLAAGTAADAPDLVETKYHEFTDRRNTSPEQGEARLLSARPEGRFDLWDVALDGYREDHLRGTGAGTYVQHWLQDRPERSDVINAHSLYLEVLSELGLVGLVLLVIVLGLILAGFAWRARGPDRALFAALLAAGLAWAVHAGVDWDWQMPAVTLWLFAAGGAALARPLRRRRKSSGDDVRLLAIRIGGVVACIAIAILPARAALSQARLGGAIDAMYAGHCAEARHDARSSLSATSDRSAPYAVIAYCETQTGEYDKAVVATRKALVRDPGSWSLYYGLAVARAGAGLDPTRAARTAARLNPLDPIARFAPRLLQGSGPAAWRAKAQRMPLLPPSPADP